VPPNAVSLQVLTDLRPCSCGEDHCPTLRPFGLIRGEFDFTPNFALLRQDITDRECSDFTDAKSRVDRKHERQSVAAGMSCGLYDPKDTSNLSVC
jgi:hypothetical protein